MVRVPYIALNSAQTQIRDRKWLAVAQLKKDLIVLDPHIVSAAAKTRMFINQHATLTARFKGEQ